MENTTEEIDLFEHHEELPMEIQLIIESYGELGDYKACEDMLAELTAKGYTFDYGLDGCPHSLKKIEPKLTEMQKFFLDQINNHAPEMLNPGYLSTLWCNHKDINRGAASRDKFGHTSAAYRTCRKLAALGLVRQHDRKTSGGYSYQQFSIK